MRRIQFKKVTLRHLILLPVAFLALGSTLYGQHSREKTIKKEFSVQADALLKVTNSYGNLNISSWNENRVVIEVTVKTSGSNPDRVQEKLDEISVEFDGSPSMVSAVTNFNANKRGWGWNWGRRNNVNMQINYTIKVPVKNNVHLSNDYGNITLDRIDGHAKISCDYGRLEIGELRGRNNQLKFDYTSKSHFGYINSASITADYSGFTVDKAGNLDLTADYTNATIGELENLTYTNDYGALEVSDVKNVQGRGDYITVKLGNVHGNVDINADYGSLDIDRMAENGGNLNLQTEYTGVKIGYAPEYYFKFEISTEYADVKGKDAFEVNISREKTSERYYQGFHGQEQSGNLVYISSRYGSISFKTN